jgi:hypothetical protein
MSHSKHNEHHDNANVGHEVSKVQVGGITWFIIVLTVSVVFIGWLMVSALNTFEGREKKAELESRPSPFAAERAKLPPEPRLQLAPNSEVQIDKNEPPNLKTQHPLEEMKELRKRWDEQLKSYGWVDEQGGVVRIPIDDAKKLLLQRGLPTRPAKKPEPAAAGGDRQQQ